MKSNLAKASAGNSEKPIDVAAPVADASGGGGGGAIDGEDSLRGSNWDSKFMNADPLAGLLDVPEPQAAKSSAESPPKPKPTPVEKTSVSSGGAAPAPIPAFLSFG